MYRLMAYNLFWWCHYFLVKKWPFCQNVLFLKLCHNHFLETFFVAPLFLDICIEVFGAWVNHKNISNSNIFEGTAVFAKDAF